MLKKLKTGVLPLLLAAVFLFSSCGGNLLMPFGIGDNDAFNPVNMNTIREPDFVEHTVARLLYETLSETEKQAYRRIYNTVFDHPSKILLPYLSQEELERVFLALKFDNPHLLCLQNTYTYYSAKTKVYILPDYNGSARECAEKSAELLRAAEEFFAELSPTAGEYEKELALHDALINAVEYSDGADSDTAYGALVKKKAACGGYALACKLLFDMAGISSAAISGRALDASGAPAAHMWLAARIEKEWTFVDPVWDDPLNAFGENLLRHTYFNITEEKLRATHSDYTLPDSISCTSENGDYFAKNGLLGTAENWRETLSERLGAVEKLPDHIEWRLDTHKTFENVCRELFDEGKLGDMLTELIEKFGSVSVSHSKDDDREVIHIYIRKKAEE